MKEQLRQQHEHTWDLLKGARTTNLMDHYDNIEKYIKYIENKPLPDELFEVTMNYVTRRTKDIRDAKKYRREFARFLLNMYNQQRHAEDYPEQGVEDPYFRVYAKNIDDLRQANIDIKFVVVKRKQT